MVVIDFISAWLSVIFLILVVVIWPLRLSKTTRKTALHRKLRKQHITLAHFLIVFSIIHGVSSSISLLSFNFGSILTLLFILIGLTYSLKGTALFKGKRWMIAHRVLTIVSIVVFFIHIWEVGGLRLTGEIIESWKNPQQIEQPVMEDPKIVFEKSDMELNIDTDIEDQNILDDTLNLIESDSNTPITINENISESELEANAEDTSNDNTSAQDNLNEESKVIETVSTDPVYKDGVWEGSARGFGPNLTVEVTTKNSEITKIEIVSHNERNSRYYDKAFNNVPDRIIDAQSTEVDIVSGATYSSIGIINAVRAALSEALISGEIPEQMTLRRH